MSHIETFHEARRRHAHLASYADGRLPMQPDFALFGAIFEDDNVYHVYLTDEWPGPAVHVAVGALQLDYWPCLTYERAVDRAAYIVGASA